MPIGFGHYNGRRPVRRKSATRAFRHLRSLAGIWRNALRFSALRMRVIG
jgi:hypothetical protein